MILLKKKDKYDDFPIRRSFPKLKTSVQLRVLQNGDRDNELVYELEISFKNGFSPPPLSTKPWAHTAGRGHPSHITYYYGCFAEIEFLLLHTSRTMLPRYHDNEHHASTTCMPATDTHARNRKSSVNYRLLYYFVVGASFCMPICFVYCYCIVCLVFFFVPQTLLQGSSAPLPEYKTSALKKSRWVLSHYGVFKTCWDWLILIATFYVAIVVPYNASFVNTDKPSMVSDVVVESLFIVGKPLFINHYRGIVPHILSISIRRPPPSHPSATIPGWFDISTSGFETPYVYTINDHIVVPAYSFTIVYYYI